MTSPIPRDVKAACRAALPGLLAAHGLDAGAVVVQDEAGWVNPCYFVGDDLVVRFNSREPGVPKFRREVIAFELVGEQGVPVPEVVLHDASCRHAPYEALVVGRLPGVSIETSWPALDGSARTVLARSVGELMAVIHDVNPGGFGELADPPEARTRPFVAVVEETLEARLAEALADGVLNADDAEQARRVVAARRPALESVERPSLVHGDLHFGNVLHVEDRVTGVLDFEWCRSGDSVEDLVTAGVVRELWPDGHGPMLDAYRAARPAPERERERLAIHCVLHNVMMCVVSKRHFPQEADDTLAATRRHLVSLDRL